MRIVARRIDGPRPTQVPNDFDVTLALPPELDDEQRQHLLTIATKCPVHKVLSGEATVTVSERLEAA